VDEEGDIRLTDSAHPLAVSPLTYIHIGGV